jgi:hypothetical protein
MRCLKILGIIVLTICASTVRASDCSSDKRVIAACYDLHGQLRIHANMRLYLWATGAKRLFAVSYRPDAPEADPPLPSNIAKLIYSDRNIFGDFNICPLTPQEQGKMQIICINSASHVTTHNRK